MTEYDNIIVIPYRNRKRQLDYFITNTVPLFKQHLPNTKIVVVEQNKGKLFNRGKLLNVVFKEYKDKTKFFITHDVDLNPTAKSINEYYSRDIENEKKVLGILTSPCDTLGGIIKIRNDTIHTINGFPNDIWGWGAEDKALQNRAEFFKVVKESIFLHTCKVRNDEYFITFDDVNDRNDVNHNKNRILQYNQFKTFNANKKQNIIMQSGINNITYTILEQTAINDMVELIKVEI
jgi:hypothetical protein